MNRPVVIIGGGASGALLAIHLARLTGAARVVVVEAREAVGTGLAYSTTCPRHLLNVPAWNMSAFPDRPDHFLDWLRSDSEVRAERGSFIPRMTYGRYLRGQFGAAGVRHIRGTAISVRPDGDDVVVELAGGERLRAGRVVLAMGHFPPVDVPEVSAGVVESGAYLRNPWRGGVAPLSPDLPATLIGTGLTSVDMLLGLRESGHRGVVTMVSRHGLLSRGHAPYEARDASVIPPDAAPAALAYLCDFRKALREGCDWRAATDSLRGVSNGLWKRLSLREKRRFRQHLFHYWSVSRHRMAPEIAEAVRLDLREGRLVIRRAHVQSVVESGTGALITLRTAVGTERHEAGRVMNCTGPDTNYRRVASPLLAGLFDDGLARPGDMGVAFALDADGRVLDPAGVAHPSVYAIGPMRAGELFETTAIPEIRRQAFDLAGILAS
ncbi:NAD(P)-binding protein [Acetobacter musti]|uniref:NAD(P)-binding protein n=1 Tax=Acetobacter musti TaxID=864732 RepID=A0ABX0JP70_9PROT|nr:FAD/NAD(P)-binding protein [Acetobacter musti]NHN84854.1 NAD(P)-binding protein [Acetobacter musti]